MQAVIFHRWDDVRVEDVPVPEIGDEELLLRIHGCGLCGSDILKITGRAEPPAILGHELTGIVAQVGARVTAFQPGERVVVAHHVPCNACHYCQRGSYSMCAAFKASNIFPSGFAEYARIPAAHTQHTTLRLPDSVSDEVGSFTEPLACCLRALKRSKLQEGDTALVIGLGSIGLQLVQAARAYGAHVLGADLVASRLAMAQRLGVERTVRVGREGITEASRQFSAGRGVDVALITAGGPMAVQDALEAVRDGGTILVFAANPGMELGFDLWDLYHREISLIASYSSAPQDLPEALELLATGRVRVQELISHRLPLLRFHEGLELARLREALKIYFRIGA